MDIKMFGKSVLSIEKGLPTHQLIRNSSGSPVTTIENLQRYLPVFSQYVANDNFVTMFESLPEVYFPIKLLIERIQRARFYLVDAKTKEEIKDNDKVNRFLSNPNPLQTFDEFRDAFFAYFFITGNAYIAATTPSVISNIEKWKANSNFFVLPSNNVSIEYPSRVKLFTSAPIEELISKYKVNSGDGYMEFATNNVLHAKDLNLSFDSRCLEGKSRLSSQRPTISNLLAVYEARGTIYTNRGALGILVGEKTDESGTVPLTETEKNDIQNQYNKNYGLGAEQNQLIMSNVPMRYIKMSASIQELEPFTETFMDAVQIAGAFGIPSGLIPREDNATYDNQGIMELSVYENTVIPIVNKFLSKLNNFLGLTSSGMQIVASFDDVLCLQSMKKAKAETESAINTTAQSQFLGGLITLNDWRVKMGMPTINSPLYDKLIPLMTTDEIASCGSIIKSNQTIKLTT